MLCCANWSENAAMKEITVAAAE